MATNLEQFVENLSQTGLMSADEVSTLCDALPPEQRPADAKALARLLVRQGKLTKYQATTIYEGKHKHLVFGEYVILDRLGAGGMGVVFKARHRRMDRIVAIKFLPAEAMKSPAAVERFYREVRAAARLSHRNIVTAHDAGEHNGMHYLVMEYVEGKDLGQVVAERGPLPVEQVVECIAQAAEGLEYAHRMGVIHRDIKPGNLLLSTSGLVKILDMGLALMGESLAHDVTAAAQLTHSGQIMGTVDYMSPEQAQDTHRADERSDIYSLGCTLYRLLTGEPPYAGDTVMNRLMAHQQAPIPSLRDRRPDVPAELDAVFQRMVAKKPAERQQSMREVIDALAPFLPAGAGGPPRSSRGGTSQSMDAMGVKGVKSAASSVRTTTRPTIKAGEDTVTQQTENTNPEVAAALQSAGTRPGSISSLVVTLRRPRVRILAAVGLIAVMGLAAAGWFLFSRGTQTQKLDSVPSPKPPELLSEGTTAGQEWSGNGLAMKFCWCPPGEFKMGEAPNQVDVKLTSGFWIGKFEVTQAEYRAVMGTNPSHFSAAGGGKDLVVGVDTDKLPVERVSWYEVTEFCRMLTEQEQRAGRLPAGWEYRLLTEAQWEYACRAGAQTVYSFGNLISRLVEYAWYEANSDKRTHEVGQKLPNPWGLHDMHGNVLEWCRDWFDEKLPGGTDPEIVKEASFKVVRGGGWFDHARFCAAAYRGTCGPPGRNHELGFRVAAVQVTGLKTAAPLSAGTAAGQEWSGNGLEMKFCWCPPGEFKMGEGDHAVDVKLTRGFWLGKHEVTQGEYRQLMKGNPSQFAATGAGKEVVAGLETDKFPVENVSWEEAAEFSRALSAQEQQAGRLPAGWEYRLPTEAQWEYACRAGTQTLFSFGDNESGLSDYAWHAGNSEKRAHEVGQKRANPWGLHDVHGNVCEWCRDWHQEKLPGGSDPEIVTVASSRVLRGGCWNDGGGRCRSADRTWYDPAARGSVFGFRVAVVQVAPPKTPVSLSVGTAAGQEWSGNGLAMKFCWCPSGKFTMGEPPDQVDVKLTRGFWLAKHEVTQAEYAQVMKGNPSHFSAAGPGKDLVAGLGTEKFAVEMVSWDDATEFCRALSEQERVAGRLPDGWEYRLPTEAQWEYACRAASQTMYSFGNVESRLVDFAWYEANSQKRTHEVGQKSPNDWGLHDMHGNVWEWCRDGYQQKMPGDTDPEVVSATSNRVLRGGCWYDISPSCRSAIRTKLSPADRVIYNGFRVALVQTAAQKTPVPLSTGTTAGQEWSGNGLEMKLCWCPPGKFTMGSPKEEPGSLKEKPVNVARGFWLGKYEVTQAQWQKLMDNSPSYFSAAGKGKDRVAELDTSSFPVEQVNWEEAASFCRKLTEQDRTAGRLPADWEYTLPTEMQWEYACRAGTKTATAFGDRLGSSEANFNGNSPFNGADKGPYLQRTCPVGGYGANAWGLHDMHGNVWEWCGDSDVKVPTGEAEPEATKLVADRVIRGGGWIDLARNCRSTTRFGRAHTFRSYLVGFRVAAVQVSK